jgi:hypothetical protein
MIATWPSSAGNGTSRSLPLSLRCEQVVRDSRPGGCAHRLDRVAQSASSVSAGDEGVLLDLFVVVAGALLGVGVGGDPGEGEGEGELVRH